MSRQAGTARQVADGMRLMRVMRVTPPLALHMNMGRDGNNVGTGEYGRPDKLVQSVESKWL